MPADQQQDRLQKLLACSECGVVGLRPAAESGCLECGGCGKRYPVINGIPCFVKDEQIRFSEVDEAARPSFIKAKRLAYAGDTLIGRMYNHYHRYASAQRATVAISPLTLDICCGIGEHYPFITERERADGSLVGVDLDRFKLELYHGQSPEIQLFQASAFDLPFASGSFDVVQLLAALEHFKRDDISRVIDEGMRVLRPGGVMITCYPAEGGCLLRLGQVLMHAYIRLKTGFDLENEKAHHHISTAAEIKSVLRDRPDMQVVDSKSYPFGFGTVHSALFFNETYKKRC